MFCFFRNKKNKKKSQKMTNIELKLLSKLYTDTESALFEVGYMDYMTIGRGSRVKTLLNVIMVLNNARRKCIEPTIEHVCYYIFAVCVESLEEIDSAGIAATLSRMCGYSGGGVTFKKHYLDFILKTPLIEFEDRSAYHAFIKFTMNLVNPQYDPWQVIENDFDVPEEDTITKFLMVAINEPDILFNPTKHTEFNIKTSIYYNHQPTASKYNPLRLPSTFYSVYNGSRVLWTLIQLYKGSITYVDVLFIKDNFDNFCELEINEHSINVLTLMSLCASSKIIKYNFKTEKVEFSLKTYARMYKDVTRASNILVEMDLACECELFFEVKKFIENDALF